MKKKIAIIGMGAYGRKHLSELRRSDYFELVALCDKNIKSEFGRFDVFEDVDSMFNVKKPEAVVITTEVSAHKDMILKCMKYTKNIFVESPLALNLTEAREISYAKRTNDLNLAIGYKDRFNPTILSLIKELEKSREKIYSINFINGEIPEFDDDLLSFMLMRDIDLLRVISQSEISKFEYMKYEDSDKKSKVCVAGAKTSSDILVSFLSSALYPIRKHRIEVSTNLGEYIGDLVNYTLHKNTINGRINLKVDNENYSIRHQHRLFSLLCENKTACGLASVEDAIKVREIVK